MGFGMIAGEEASLQCAAMCRVYLPKSLRGGQGGSFGGRNILRTGVPVGVGQMLRRVQGRAEGFLQEYLDFLPQRYDPGWSPSRPWTLVLFSDIRRVLEISDDS